MTPKKICGDTWYIPSPLNVGWCNGLMIDSGIHAQQGTTMATLLCEASLPVENLINTHGHPDHCGGNAGVLEGRNITLYATEKQVPFIQNSGWVEAFIHGSCAVLPYENQKFLQSQSSLVDKIIPMGTQFIGNCEATVFPLEGHWLDCIGIATNDNVLFCGDAVLGADELNKYAVPLYFDIDLAIQSLNQLKDTAYSYYVPSHGKLTDDIHSLANQNLAQLQKILEVVLDCCQQPMTREALCAALCEKLGVYESIPQWQIAFSTCGAAITNLCKQGEIMPYIKQHQLFYIKR